MFPPSALRRRNGSIKPLAARDFISGTTTVAAGDVVVFGGNIGYGSPNKQGTADAHGAPLGDEEIRLTKKNLNWPEDSSFLVPEEAPSVAEEINKRGVRPIPIKANLPARNGGSIRCATLVLNRDE